MTWNPGQYLQYEDARLRPALDLMARVPLDRPSTIVDQGCGAGNVAQWLHRRWPDARILGVDADAAMLDRARAATQHVPAFAWWDGEKTVEHELDRFLATARTAFARRERTLLPAEESLLRGVHAERDSSRFVRT